MNNEISANVYHHIRETVLNAKTKIYSAVNFAMVEAYWEIGREIVAAQGERAEYGKQLLKYLADQLSNEFGNGFSERNLQNMRQFHLAFQIPNTLCSELSWSHYRLLMRIEDREKRNFYMKECAESNWSARQLERQINSFFMSVCSQLSPEIGTA